MGGGGMRFRSLEVAKNPDRQKYYVSQQVDMEGAIIRARFAGDAITLTSDNYTYTPSGALTENDDHITLTSTIGGVTRSATIPIEVLDISPTLDLNDWEAIAEAAKTGIADKIWHIGDTKNQVINGKTYTLKVIGFHHDELADSDEERNNAEYNGNTKKAAIVFQFMQSPGTAFFHTSSDWNIAWKNSSMRNTTLANLYNGLPSDMKAAIRKVKKYSAGRYASEAQETEDRLFLGSVAEIFGQNTDTAAAENAACKRYEYYLAGNIPPHENVNWLRSAHCNCSLDEYHFAIVANNGAKSWSTHMKLGYCPIFCV